MPLAILPASSGNQVLSWIKNNMMKLVNLRVFFVSFTNYIGGGNLWIRLKLI